MEEKVNRRYFEIWGDLVAHNKTLVWLTCGLLVANIILSFSLYTTSKKPPLVIHVNENGEVVRKNRPNFPPLSKPEVLTFIKRFATLYYERNAYTIEQNLTELKQFITSKFSEQLKTDGNFEREIQSTKSNQLKTVLEFSSISVTKETETNLFAELTLWRGLASYRDPEFKRERILFLDLVLKKCPRTTETPYGLLVETCLEKTIKNETH